MPAASSASPRIDLSDLTIRHGAVPVFERLSLSVKSGEVFCLLGASGTGKSTLLRALAGLVLPDAGSVAFAPEGAVGLMAQDDALLPWARPVANVTLGARLRGEREDRARAWELLAAVGLAGVDRRPDQLSGGMRKRVALARLLYEERPIALLDEPFASLDALTRREMQALTLKLLRGRTVVLVTHDPFEAIAMADRVGVIAGRPARLTLDAAMPPSDGTLRDPGSPGLFPLYRRILEALGA